MGSTVSAVAAGEALAHGGGEYQTDPAKPSGGVSAKRSDSFDSVDLTVRSHTICQLESWPSAQRTKVIFPENHWSVPLFDVELTSFKRVPNEGSSCLKECQVWQ